MGKIINTPFGPLDPDSRLVVDGDSTDPRDPYPTVDPRKGFAPVEPREDPEGFREARRINRLAVQHDRIILADIDWRVLDSLDPDSQFDLAEDYFRLKALFLPWFLDRFSDDDARQVKTIFPHRAVYFEGVEVLI